MSQISEKKVQEMADQMTSGEWQPEQGEPEGILMSYVVTEETIRLNQEATELAAQVRRVRKDAKDLWARIQRDLAIHRDMMIDLGSYAHQQMAKEAELWEAVEREQSADPGAVSSGS